MYVALDAIGFMILGWPDPSHGALLILQNRMFFLLKNGCFQGWFHHPQIPPVPGPQDHETYEGWGGCVLCACSLIFRGRTPWGTNKTWWRRWALLGSFDFIGGLTLPGCIQRGFLLTGHWSCCSYVWESRCWWFHLFGLPSGMREGVPITTRYSFNPSFHTKGQPIIFFQYISFPIFLNSTMRSPIPSFFTPGRAPPSMKQHKWRWVSLGWRFEVKTTSSEATRRQRRSCY